MADKTKTYGVRIKALSGEINKATIFKWFRHFGPIDSVKVFKSMVGGYTAYVNFLSQEVAEVAANEMNKQLIDGVEVTTSCCKTGGDVNSSIKALTDCKLFMNSLACKVSPEQIEQSDLEYVGIYWDIENCSLPKKMSPAAAANKIRNSFLTGKKLFEFHCVCDIKKMPELIVNELVAAEVNVLHVAATAKNSADEKLKNFILKFGHSVKPPATVVLISGDANFAPVLYKLRFELNFNTILLHNTQATEQLKQFAQHAYLFPEFLADVKAPPVTPQLNNTKIKVTGLPLDIHPKVVAKSLNILADNCGGKVIDVAKDAHGTFAVLSFKSPNDGYKGKCKLKGELVGGSKIDTKFLSSGDFRSEALNLLKKFPYWLSLPNFEKFYMEKYKERCDVRELCTLKDVVYVDGKPGRKFVCQLKFVEGLKIEHDKEQFQQELVELLRMHNRKVPFASLPGLYWSYFEKQLAFNKNGCSLGTLVESCPNVEKTASGLFLLKNYDKKPQKRMKTVVKDVIQLLTCLPNCETPINQLFQIHQSYFGFPCILASQGLDEWKLLKAAPNGSLRISQKDGEVMIMLDASYRRKLIGADLLKLVSNYNAGSGISLEKLPMEFYKFNGMQLPRSHSVKSLKKLLSSWTKDVKVISSESSVPVVVPNKEFGQFKQGLMSLLERKENGILEMERLEEEYDELYGCSLKLDSLGFSNSTMLFKELEPEIVVKPFGDKLFICLSDWISVRDVATDDPVVKLLSEKKLMLVSELLPEILKNDVTSLASVSSGKVMVLGRGQSTCLMLSSIYRELAFDDNVMVLCKTLYRLPNFSCPEDRLHALLVMNGLQIDDSKRVLDVAVALGDVIKKDDEVVLASPFAVRLFSCEVLLLLKEKFSIRFPNLCGLYHKKFGIQFKLQDFGLTSLKALLEACSKTMIIELNVTGNEKLVNVGSIGRFLIKAKLMLDNENRAVLKCAFLDTYRAKHGHFSPQKHGFSSLTSLLLAFPEFFFLLPSNSPKGEMVICREQSVAKSQGLDGVKPKETTEKKKTGTNKKKTGTNIKMKTTKGNPLSSNFKQGSVAGKIESVSTSNDDDDEVVVASEDFLHELSSSGLCKETLTTSQSDIDLIQWTDCEESKSDDWWMTGDSPSTLPRPLTALVSSEEQCLIDFDTDVDEVSSQDYAGSSTHTQSLSDLHILDWD